MTIDPRLSSFVARCDEVAGRLGLKRSTLSAKLFMDGKRIEVLEKGESDIGIGRLARAERELSALEGVADQERSAA